MRRSAAAALRPGGRSTSAGLRSLHASRAALKRKGGASAFKPKLKWRQSVPRPAAPDAASKRAPLAAADLSSRWGRTKGRRRPRADGDVAGAAGAGAVVADDGDAFMRMFESEAFQAELDEVMEEIMTPEAQEVSKRALWLTVDPDDVREAISGGRLGRSVESYNILLNALGARGDLAAADAVLRQDMVEAGVSPDAVSFSALLRACIPRRDADLADRIFHAAAARGVRPDGALYGAYVSALCAAGDVRRAWSAFRRMRERVPAPLQSAEAFNAILLLLSRQRQWSLTLRSSRTWDVWAELIRSGVAPDAESYEALAHHCGESGEAERCLGLLDEMPTFGCRPTATFFSRLFKAIARAPQYIPENAGLLREGLEKMSASEVLPDAGVFAAAIHAAGACGDAHAAEAIYGAMALYGVAPSDAVKRCLLSAHANAASVGRRGGVLPRFLPPPPPEAEQRLKERRRRYGVDVDSDFTVEEVVGRNGAIRLAYRPQELLDVDEMERDVRAAEKGLMEAAALGRDLSGKFAVGPDGHMRQVAGAREMDALVAREAYEEEGERAVERLELDREDLYLEDGRPMATPKVTTDTKIRARDARRAALQARVRERLREAGASRLALAPAAGEALGGEDPTASEALGGEALGGEALAPAGAGGLLPAPGAAAPDAAGERTPRTVQEVDALLRSGAYRGANWTRMEIVEALAERRIEQRLRRGEAKRARAAEVALERAKERPAGRLSEQIVAALCAASPNALAGAEEAPRALPEGFGEGLGYGAGGLPPPTPAAALPGVEGEAAREAAGGAAGDAVGGAAAASEADWDWDWQPQLQPQPQAQAQAQAEAQPRPSADGDSASTAAPAPHGFDPAFAATLTVLGGAAPSRARPGADDDAGEPEVPEEGALATLFKGASEAPAELPPAPLPDAAVASLQRLGAALPEELAGRPAARSLRPAEAGYVAPHPAGDFGALFSPLAPPSFLELTERGVPPLCDVMSSSQPSGAAALAAAHLARKDRGVMGRRQASALLRGREIFSTMGARAAGAAGGESLTTDDMNAMLRVYAAALRVRSAAAFLESYAACGVAADARTVRVVLKMLVDAKRVAVAREVLEGALESAPEAVDTACFGIVADAVARRGDAAAATEIVEAWERREAAAGRRVGPPPEDASVGLGVRGWGETPRAGGLPAVLDEPPASFPERYSRALRALCRKEGIDAPLSLPEDPFLFVRKIRDDRRSDPKGRRVLNKRKAAVKASLLRGQLKMTMPGDVAARDGRGVVRP